MAARQGYRVCVNYRSSRAEAQALVKEICDGGGEAIACRGDVGNEDDVKQLFADCQDRLGPPTVLVNNAGIVHKLARLDQTGFDRWERTFRTNVLGALLCCREAVMAMSTIHGGAGGAIVNVSSGAVKAGSPNRYVEYAASKGALEVLTVGLAKEVVGEAIRVNAVRVGLVDTELHARAGQPDEISKATARVPMRRAADPSEIAAAILWLASGEASFVTGAILDVAGGG